MGKRGPKPTPSKILKLRGSWRGEANKNEPEPEAGRPERPEGLLDEANAGWDQLVEMLDGIGLLTAIDGRALARYCQYWARWWECENFISKYGMTYPIKDKQGAVLGMAEFPQVKRSQALSQTLSKLEAEFGLTPSARTRITVEKQGEQENQGFSKFRLA